jgi:tRNA pseudouridine55 synthase
MNGFLLVDKAGGMTSHDVVAKARKKFGTKRVGHAGTLDPMATGVLVLGVGNATKLLQYVVDGKKSYEATIKLGVATHTDDREGDVISTADASAVTEEQIRTGLQQYVGTIMQRPSSVSAIKIDGKRAHERVRQGEDVEIPAREVTIYQLISAKCGGVRSISLLPALPELTSEQSPGISVNFSELVATSHHYGEPLSHHLRLMNVRISRAAH